MAKRKLKTSKPKGGAITQPIGAKHSAKTMANVPTSQESRVIIVIVSVDGFYHIHDLVSPSASKVTSDWVQYTASLANIADPSTVLQIFAVDSASVVESTVTLLNILMTLDRSPMAVISLGLAGGIRSKVSLGDVVVATSVRSHLASVSFGQDDTVKLNSLQADTSTIASHAFLGEQNFLRETFDRWRLECERDMATYFGTKLYKTFSKRPLSSGRPAIHYGGLVSMPVASSSRMVRSLEEQNAAICAVDMESGGVLWACSRIQKNRPLAAIAIRGVSNFADEDESGDLTPGLPRGAIQRVAIRNAYRFLVETVRTMTSLLAPGDRR